MSSKNVLMSAFVGWALILLVTSNSHACWWCWHGYPRHYSVGTGSTTTTRQGNGDASGDVFGSVRTERARAGSDGAATPSTATAQPELSAAMLLVEALQNPELRVLARKIIAKAVDTGTEPSMLRKLLQPILDQDALVGTPHDPAVSELEKRISVLEAKTADLEKRVPAKKSTEGTMKQTLSPEAAAVTAAMKDAVEKLGEAAETLEATAKEFRRARRTASTPMASFESVRRGVPETAPLLKPEAAVKVQPRKKPR